MKYKQRIMDVRELPVVMTVRDAAILLDTPEANVRKQIAAGTLPGFKFGRDWRIRRADMLAFCGLDYPGAAGDAAMQ